jgi:hypothetical protein
VVGLDWSRRVALFKRESPIPGPLPFEG